MPYIISGMVMIAMFYVMMFLNNSKGLGKVPDVYKRQILQTLFDNKERIVSRSLLMEKLWESDAYVRCV